jgi:hypothetical protein
MTASRQASDPRLEPLLWLQLLGIGVIPAEGLALLLLLGSVDPGPLPGLERLLIWALGVLAPAMLLWRRPADCWSLLLFQAPQRGRRDLQRRLSRLQVTPLLRVALAVGAALLLPAIWILDQAGGLATGFSPLTGTSRLVVLLLSIPLLAVILWQWQQLLQALWLLSRPNEAVLQAPPLSPEELEQTRLSVGLPVLLIEPLQAVQGTEQASGRQTPVPAPPKEPMEADKAPSASEQPETSPEAIMQPGTRPEPSAPVAIEPEQAAGDAQGGDLDQQIVDLDP